MWPRGYFPISFFAPSYWPKTGALRTGGGHTYGGLIRYLMELEARKRARTLESRLRQRVAAVKMERAQKALEYQAEAYHQQRVRASVAYSLVLAEL